MLAIRRERTRELVGVARRHIEAGEWDAACRALRRCTVSAWVAEAPELMSSLAIGFAGLPEGTTVDAAEAPELMLLFGVLRHTVTGETRAVQSDIRTAVAALLRADTTDPVARLGTLALAAFGQLLVDRPDDAAATLTRGHELLEGLDPAVRTRRRDEMAPAMCDAAVVGVLLDRIPESLPLWQWVSDNVADCPLRCSLRRSWVWPAASSSSATRHVSRRRGGRGWSRATSPPSKPCGNGPGWSEPPAPSASWTRRSRRRPWNRRDDLSRCSPTRGCS